MNVINIIIFQVFMFTLIISLVFIYKNNKLESKYKKIMESVIEYEKIIDEQGKKTHEYNNQLMILKGYINNSNKLESYLDTIIEGNKIGQNFEIRQLAKFPNGGLKELLYYKISKIKENNIKYYLYISDDSTELLENLSTKLYNEMTKVFGVLIDNAIEAAIDSKDKEVSIDFDKEDHYITIIISNSYNKNIDLNKIGKKSFSTKGRGHGFGLSLVKEIIKKNNIFELFTDYDDKYYIQTFLIDTKDEKNVEFFGTKKNKK